MAPLNDQQTAFCKAYFAQTGKKNGAAAAIEAGYSPRSARFIASDLLKDPRVAALLKQMEASAKRQTTALLAYRIEPDGIDGEIIPPDVKEAIDNKVGDLLLAALCRDWVTQRMMRNVQLGMAEIKITQTRILKAQDGNYTAIEVEAFERDAAGANTAMALLMKELDRRDAVGKGAETEASKGLPALTTNPLLAEAYDKFKNGYIDRRAAANAAKPVNGATNGRGH